RHAGDRAQGRWTMKRALFVALAAACAQQEAAKRTSQPAAAAMESGGADGGVVSPGSEPHKPAAAPAGSRAATPAAAQGEQRASLPPDVKRLSSGLSLLELPANQNAILNVQLRFRTGSVDDPRGKAGLTYLTARVMTEGGTQPLSAKQLLGALFPPAAELAVPVDQGPTTILAPIDRDNLAKPL